MTTIRAIIRNGRIEVDRPINLPDGTEFNISIPDPPRSDGIPAEDQADTPEAIEAWLRWYDALEPLEFTPEERAAWESARQEQKQFELAQWEERSQRIEGHFP